MSVSAYPPIADYALIGDCHSAALVSRDGSVDWCCFHRFDASPVFSRVLDWSRGGHFRIAPARGGDVTRSYAPGTNVLRTRFESEWGVIVVTDFFAVDEQSQTPGEVRPYHQMIRHVRCEAGRAEVLVEFSPRFEYGLTRPRVAPVDDSLAIVYGGPDGLSLQSEISLEPNGPHDLVGRGEMRAGEERFLSLTYQRPGVDAPQRLPREDLAGRRNATLRFWRDWSARCRYEGPYRDAVVRSALVLKSLTNSPTGAIVAAPTTSLPEQIGGSRNWDYRFTWIRDSALELSALFRLGYVEEAHAFMGWLKRTAAGTAENLQVVYGVAGERLIPEIELEHLEGYAGSAPVRIGNAARDQFQLDVYGELLDAAWQYHRNGGDIDDEYWEFLESVVDRVAERWTEPDRGIWEVRGPGRHFTSSKVFAWVALARAIALGKALGHTARLAEWRGLRDEIRRTVESKGVGRDHAFVRSFGDDDVDASSLLVPLVGFLPGDDPRVLATIDKVERELLDGGLVRRYVTHDGLPGDEGAFVIATFWLADALALAGRLDRAKEIFERTCAYANDVGLLSEEIDRADGALLGNFPQAFSHVGLISAALTLEAASREGGRRA